MAYTSYSWPQVVTLFWGFIPGLTSCSLCRRMRMWPGSFLLLSMPSSSAAMHSLPTTPSLELLAQTFSHRVAFIWVFTSQQQKSNQYKHTKWCFLLVSVLYGSTPALRGCSLFTSFAVIECPAALEKGGLAPLTGPDFAHYCRTLQRAEGSWRELATPRPRSAVRHECTHVHLFASLLGSIFPLI